MSLSTIVGCLAINCVCPIWIGVTCLTGLIVLFVGVYGFKFCLGSCLRLCWFAGLPCLLFIGCVLLLVCWVFWRLLLGLVIWMFCVLGCTFWLCYFAVGL